MYKAILLFMLFPYKTNKDFIKNKICIRNIVFLLFILEFISLLIIFINKFSNIKISIISAIIFSLIGTYFTGVVNAFILYVADKKFINKILKYKTCFKLIIPKLILDVLETLTRAVLVFIGVEISREASLILSTLRFVCFIILFSYYLRNIYNCRVKHVALIDMVYSVLFIAPILGSNILR